MGRYRYLMIILGGNDGEGVWVTGDHRRLAAYCEHETAGQDLELTDLTQRQH